MSASISALKLFKSASRLQPQTTMVLSHYFEAIKAGDLLRVKQWFLKRSFSSRSIDESAWDLACLQNRPDIAQVIQEQMAKDSAREQALFGTLDQKGPYKRTYLRFDNTHFFRYLLFETNKDFFFLQTGYNTQMEAPFVQKALQHLDGKAFSDRMYFHFFLNEHSREDIRQRVIETVDCLLALKKKDGTEIDFLHMRPVLTALEIGFVDASLGFPPHDEPLVSHGEQIPNTYEGYEMYEAAAHADYERILALLRAGADPNARFNATTALQTAAHLGTEYVFNRYSPYTEDIRYTNLLATIKLLLEHGADPGIENHDETLMEFLVRYSQFVKPEVQAMYQEIIALITVHKQARKHILVHPDVVDSPLSRRVQQANDEMDKKTQPNPCIASVIKYGEILSLLMLDGELLKIESRKIDALDEAEYEILFQYFNTQKSLHIESGISKRDYFDSLMRIYSGTGYVEMIWHRGQLKGYVVSNVISTVVAGNATTIYYAKLALAQLPSSYAGIMKAMLFMRGFSWRNEESNQEVITFYEAASARGFGLSDIINRFPTVPVLKESMPEILSQVYEGYSSEIEMHQGAWYVKDAMRVDEPQERFSQRWPTFSSLVRDNYQAIYQRSGWAMAMAFPNDEDNYDCFQKQLIPLIGEEAFNALLAFYHETGCSVSSVPKFRCSL